MKKNQWLIIFLLLIGGTGLMSDFSAKEIRVLDNFLPRALNGWIAEENDKVYNPQTIFDYIDGAGEVYRSYNFQELLVRRFSQTEKPDIIVDFFKMTSSKDAFGVFTHDLEGDDAKIGQGSTYKGGLLQFWKGSYFVSIYTEEETKEAEKVVFSLGQHVAASIKEEGDKPDLLRYLPPESVDDKSVHYFHNHLILNYHFYVSDENILLLDQKTEAVLGTGFEKDEEFKLLLVRYPEKGKASRAYKGFVDAYMPDEVGEGLVQTEDLKWTAAKVSNDLLIIVFNAPSDVFANKMIKKIMM